MIKTLVLTHIKFVTSCISWPISTPKLCRVVVAPTTKEANQVQKLKGRPKLDKGSQTDNPHKCPLGQKQSNSLRCINKDPVTVEENK